MLQQVEGNIMVVTACKVSAYNADLAAGADVAAVGEFLLPVLFNSNEYSHHLTTKCCWLCRG